MPAQLVISTIYFPRRGDEPLEPVPYVLTERELIRFVRLDETGGERPDLALARYRQKGLLRGAKVGRELRYTLAEAMAFMERLAAG